MLSHFADTLKGDNRHSLMGFSILWVILFHFCLYGNLLRFAPLNLLFGKGYLGVDVFFLLSSYGLCHSFTKNSIPEFYRNRFFRLFPVYPLFLFLLLLMYGATFTFPSWKIFIFQITGLSCFIDMDIEWYIPALILLYVLFPLIYKSIEICFAKCRLAIFIVLSLLVALCPHLSGFVNGHLVMRLPIIVVGVVTFFALRNNDIRFLILTYVLCFAIGFCFQLFSDKLELSLMLPLFLLGVSMLYGLSIPSLRLLTFCGKHSLELYLAQNLALNHFYATSDMSFVMKTGVTAGIIVVGSVILWGVQEVWNNMVKTV